MKRKFKYGAAGAAFAAIFLAVLIVINLIVSVLADKTNMTLDMTSDARASVSDKTYMLLDSLTEDVKIYTMVDAASLNSQFSYGQYYYNYGQNIMQAQVDNYSLSDYINKYDMYSDHVTAEQVDTVLDPTFAREYGVTSPYDIVVATENKYKVIPMTDMYVFDSGSDEDSMYVSGICVEQKLTNAIEYAITEQLQSHVYVTNHSESVFDAYLDLAEEAGYDNSAIDLMTEEIPEEVKYLSIVAPDADYSEAEIKKLQQFLDRGDVTIAVYNYSGTDGLTNLSGFLSDCGIGISSGLENVIIDDTKFVGDKPVIIASYGESGFTQELDSSLNLLTPYASPITLRKETHDFTTETILTSADSSYLNGDRTQTGPFDTCVQATKQISVNGVVLTSRVIVNSSYMMANDDYLGGSGISNADFVLSCFNTTADTKINTHIGTVNFTDNYLKMSQSETLVFTYLFVYIIPIGLLVTGLVIFIRRKHK